MATTAQSVRAGDLRQAVTASPIAMCVLDPDGTALFGNPAYADLLGVALADIPGMGPEDVFPEDELPQAAACLERLLSGAAERVQREYRMKRGDGTAAHALTSTTVTRDAKGRPRFVVFQAFDLAERRATHDQLARRLAQQETVVAFGRRALTGDVPFDELCQEAVELVISTLGVDRAHVAELEADHVHVRVRRGVPSWLTGMRVPVAGTLLERLLATGAPAVVEHEDERPPALVDHGLRSAVLVAIGDPACPFGAIGAYSEASRVFHADERHFLSAMANVLAEAVRREWQETELRRLALHDPNTGLPSRPLFEDRLHEALRTARRNATQVGVLFIDLDDFKAVNDSLGHQAGDAVLKAVAVRLRGAVRPGDTVARFGGDEFVIVAPGLSGADEAMRLAEDVVAALAEPVVTRGVEHVVRASIGVRVADPRLDGAVSAEALLRDADTAMYRAKERGGAHAEILDEAGRGQAQDRLRIEQDLRNALAHDQLRLVYQPFTRLRDGSWFGAETLLRWEHPVHGLIGPDRFLDVAERSGLIVPIGEWILREACRHGARWRSYCGEDFLLTVNVSPRQLGDAGLVDAVSRALAASGLPARNLGVELTEQALIGDDRGIDDVLAQLAALGVQILLDDFGTGFSSLSHLARFPIDGLKIDRSFIAPLEEDGDAQIIAAIIAMARATGKFVIPEGIETSTHAKALLQQGCALGQGYHFAKPMPAAQFDTGVGEHATGTPARLTAAQAPAKFAAAARRILAGLESQLPPSGLYVSHLDEGAGIVRFLGIVGGEEYGVAAGDEIPLEASLCKLLVDRDGPALTGDAGATIYGTSPMQQTLGIESYVGAPVWAGGEVVGTLCAVSRDPGAYLPGDLRLLMFAASMLSDLLGEVTADDVHEHLRRVPVTA